MPYNSFGIGTQFIGKRDFSSDGSFVTTEFQIAILPLYPIRTVRVIEGKSSTENHIFSRTFHTDYRVLAQGIVNTKQAAYVYSYTAVHVLYFLALAVIGPTWLLERLPITNALWIFQAAMFMLPVSIPLAMRFKAKSRALESATISCPCGSGLVYKSCCLEHSEALKNQERNFYKKFTY
jgi:hypothetical protein